MIICTCKSKKAKKIVSKMAINYYGYAKTKGVLTPKTLPVAMPLLIKII